MRFRVSLPTKVLLSYLLVVAVGAVPTYIWLTGQTRSIVADDTAAHLTNRLDRVAKQLRAPTVDRIAYLESAASLLSERVTLIDPDGAVLYDSHVSTDDLGAHGQRPEVLEARRGEVGVAVRTSASTGFETVYVAKRVGGSHAGDQVLRLSVPMTGIAELSARTERVVRNAQAVAVSVALGLSLLAAFVFARPLIRVRRAAERIAAGDFTVSLGRLANDEVGDVGRALETLVPELRKRMAVAGAGEALLVQLVEVLDTPLAVFEVDGDVLALNGAARRFLSVEGPNAGQRLREMLDDEGLRQALALAEEEGQPQPTRLRAKRATLDGASVFVLKRPGSAPLGLLIGPELHEEDVDVPRPSDVETLELDALLGAATRSADGEMKQRGVEVEAPDNVPEVTLADCDGRLLSAVSRTLLSCASSFGGRPGRIQIGLEVEPTRVGLALDAAPGAEDLVAIRPLLEPLGGAVDVETGETTLWLPRA
jgi:HAMP domain-containing protein